MHTGRGARLEYSLFPNALMQTVITYVVCWLRWLDSLVSAFRFPVALLGIIATTGNYVSLASNEPITEYDHVPILAQGAGYDH